ncbi:RNA-binding protein with serine-rich domain 1 [Entomortierella beljakovae]|nr:RNA-binding protein with serine-rich domain 1 [Entomortierella beljakovae]
MSRSHSPRSGSRSPHRKVQRHGSRSPSPNNDVSLNSAIKIGNLTRNVGEGHIREIFGAYGKIKTINFPMNPRFRFNMGFAEIEYENKEEAQIALEGWNGGQLDGEIVEVSFVTKITKVPPPPARPVRSRVPPSPRRGARARSPLPPPHPRRRGEDHYSPPRRGNFDGPPAGRRDYYSPPSRRRDGYSPPPQARRNFNVNNYSPPRRGKGANAAPLGGRMTRGRSPLPPRGRRRSFSLVLLFAVGGDRVHIALMDQEVVVAVEADHLVEEEAEDEALAAAEVAPQEETEVVAGV